MNPRYPIYVISKGRYESGITARMFIKDGTPFHLVVEPQEEDQYVRIFGKDHVYVLPFSNLGLGSIPARNWVWDHAIKAGYERHWIFDDNIYAVYRRYKGKRTHCSSRDAISIIECFVDRYENIAIAGMNYEMFVPEKTKSPPFRVNVHVYSNLLILNGMQHRWRGRYNEDTDLCLQVLSAGMCTVQFCAFLVAKQTTMISGGGNSDELYKGDGRLRMSRDLERQWPFVATTKRRYGRPQHSVCGNWTKFTTPLKLKPGVDLAAFKKNGEYGLKQKPRKRHER